MANGLAGTTPHVLVEVRGGGQAQSKHIDSV